MSHRTPHPVRRWWTAIPCAVAALSCRESPAELVPVDVSESIPCEHSGQCPSGTRCLGPSLEPARCSEDGSAGAAGERNASPALGGSSASCRVPSGNAEQVFRAELQTGFGVRAMDISVDREQSPSVLRWSAPKTTSVVRCVLLGGVPEFGEVGGRITILNYEKIVLHRQDAEPNGAFQFEIDRQQDGSRDSDGQRDKKYLVDRLLAGCWAYDSIDLIRATDLIAVSPSEVADETGLLTTECTKDGHSCIDGSTFGVCLEGACRKRCSSTQDCEPASVEPSDTTGAGGETAIPDCSFECKAVRGPVGACVPVASSEVGP